MNSFIHMTYAWESGLKEPTRLGLWDTYFCGMVRGAAPGCSQLGHAQRQLLNLGPAAPVKAALLIRAYPACGTVTSALGNGTEPALGHRTSHFLTVFLHLPTLTTRLGEGRLFLLSSDALDAPKPLQAASPEILFQIRACPATCSFLILYTDLTKGL